MIRSERPGDYEAIARIHTLAFGHDWEAELIRRLRENGPFDPDFSLVSDEGEGALGHVMFTPVTIEDTVNSVPAVVLAPLAVLAEHRSGGHGTKLVTEGIRRCKERGDRIMVVYGGPYYDRFGFELARDHHIFRPDAIPGQQLRVLELVPGALEGVSGVIRYPRAFGPLLVCTD